MKIPLLDLEAQNKPIEKEILAAIERVVRSNTFILGPEVKKLEGRVADYCHVDHAVGVSSGTDALVVSLMALGIGPGDEVITTPFSFFATAGAIARLGARPVFVDIDPVTYNIDPGLIEPAINPRTKAVIPVHLYGQCADMQPIMDLANEYRLAVVEDAAQAIGAEYVDGRRAGSMGDMGCLSFFPSKNLGAFGDGGMVVTNNPELAERIRKLRVHGASPKYYHKLVGGNFRLDAIQAAVLDVKMDYLDGWTRKRQANADHYLSLFTKGGLTQTIKLPAAVYRTSGRRHYHIYNQFVIQVPGKRDSVRRFLQGRGIGTEIYYPLPFHLQECFAYLDYQPGDFPRAESASREILALPIYPELTPAQRQAVVGCIAGFRRRPVEAGDVDTALGLG